MANEHFPRLGHGGEGRCPVAHGNGPDGSVPNKTNDKGKASASARDKDAAIAAAAMLAAMDEAAKCPRHTRGLSRDLDVDDAWNAPGNTAEGTSGILARGDSVKSGVASGAGADAVSAAASVLARRLADQGALGVGPRRAERGRVAVATAAARRAAFGRGAERETRRVDASHASRDELSDVFPSWRRRPRRRLRIRPCRRRR